MANRTLAVGDLAALEVAIGTLPTLPTLPTLDAHGAVVLMGTLSIAASTR